MSLYSLVSDLPVIVESYELEGLEQGVSSDFVRRTTVVHLRGGGEEGVGEDVIYDAEDQLRFQAAGPVLDLAGRHTLDSLSSRFEGLPDLRRWGFESAALDLALRQAGRALHEVLEREPRPVTFVVSTSLPDGSADRLRTLPGHRFKLDPEGSWGEAVRSVVVTNIADDVVTVDGNHPLAGQNLHFNVEIVDVRPATREELEHGHVHGHGGHHH